MINEPLYSVGERVRVFLILDGAEHDTEGEIVEVWADEGYYKVECDLDGQVHLLREDNLDIIPTANELRQFAALVDRVHNALTGDAATR